MNIVVPAPFIEKTVLSKLNREKGHKLSRVSSHKGPNPIRKGRPPPNAITPRIRLQQKNFGETQTFQLLWSGNFCLDAGHHEFYMAEGWSLLHFFKYFGLCSGM